MCGYSQRVADACDAGDDRARFACLVDGVSAALGCTGSDHPERPPRVVWTFNIALLADVEPLLQQTLGPARRSVDCDKHAGELCALLEEVGGLWTGQSLYAQPHDPVWAMLWPWADGVTVTLRVGVLAGRERATGPGGGSR